jgi:hypothetical protein
MSESSGIWEALLNAIEQLFGKVGVAVLLASVAFFLLPATWLHGIGLDQDDPAGRKIAGICLLCSAAACIVSMGIRLTPTVSSAIHRVKAQREFNSIPLGSVDKPQPDFD